MDAMRLPNIVLLLQISPLSRRSIWTNSGLCDAAQPNSVVLCVVSCSGSGSLPSCGHLCSLTGRRERALELPLLWPSLFAAPISLILRFA